MDARKVVAVTLLAGAGLLLLRSIEERKRRQRRWWVKPWLSRRTESADLVEELRLEDEESYKNYLRMNNQCFEKLLVLISPFISKQNTRLRECITAKQKLIITLRFLATGETFRSLMYQFRISESTISLFVPEVCKYIYQTLEDKYLHCPNTEEEWLRIADSFLEKWHLPNVIGAIDGKHIMFQAPKSSGSTYYNYKLQHSIVLLAVVDANYKFIYIDVGANGRCSDGGVYGKSTLNAAIVNKSLNLPKDRPLPGREKTMPFVIVADAAFPLQRNIMRPYPFRNMSGEQRIFNYRLSRARNVVENAFGIFANRFRVLLTTINLSPDKVELVTLTCCALHNFLKDEGQNYMTANPDNEVDPAHIFKNNIGKQTGNRHGKVPIEIREEFKEYVNGVGSVPWQNNF